MSTSDQNNGDVSEEITRRMQEVEIVNKASREELPQEEDESDSHETIESQEQDDAPVDNTDNGACIFEIETQNGSEREDEEAIRHVNCPSQLVGKLIGKGGETIQAIQNSTNTRIQIDQSIAGANEKRVEIRGQSSACSEAMSIISQIMTGKKLSEIEELIETAHLGTIGGPGNHVQKILYCPPKLVGRLIGKKGETVKSIQKSSGAYISIQQQGVPDNALRPISIRGPFHAVNQAAKVILEIVLSSPGISLTNLKACMMIPCPENMVGRLIGKGGETIKSLEKQSGTNIQVDQIPGNPMINITGSPLALDFAFQLIFAILSGLNAAMVAQNGASYASNIHTGYPAYRYGYYGGGIYPGVVPNSLQFPHTFTSPDQAPLHSVGTHGNPISSIGSPSPIPYYMAPPIPNSVSAPLGQGSIAASQAGAANWPGS